MEHDHEYQVQHCIEDTGKAEEQQRPFRIAHGPEHGASHIIDQQAGDTGKIDPEIHRGRLQDIVRRGHEPEHEGGQENPQGRKQDAGQKGDHDGGLHGQMELFVVVGPVMAADDDAGADGRSIEEHDHGVDDAGGGAHGCQGFCAHKISDHQAVHRIVKLLEQVADEKRNGKGEQQLPGGAGGHVHAL